MSKQDITTLVASWTDEIISGSDRELVDVEFVKEGRNWVLRVFLDKPGGIDIEDCREVSLSLSERLDKEDPIAQAYTLEVSSPGIERPLKKADDYQRYTGRSVNIKLYSAIDGKKDFQGKLVGLEAGVVKLDIGKEQVEIPQEQIARARLAVEF